MIGQALDFIDSWLAMALVDEVRVVCWGVVAGALSMGLYALASPQRRLKTLIDESNAARKALAAFDGDFSLALPLIRRTLSTSLRRLMFVLVPSLLAGLPVIAVLVWLDDRFGYDLPQPGQTVAVEVLPHSALVGWQPEESAKAVSTGQWLVTWPDADGLVQLKSAEGVALVSLPCGASTAICQKGWVETLFSCPSQSLPAGSSVESATIGLPPREMLSFGPGWLRTPLAVFLCVTCLSSLTVKGGFRIA